MVATTEDGLTFKADNVVIAAGPWTNSVLESANLPTINVKVWEIQWAHYRVKESVASSIPQAFHFRKGQCKEDGGLYYVFPASATESVPNNGNNNDEDKDSSIRTAKKRINSERLKKVTPWTARTCCCY